MRFETESIDHIENAIGDNPAPGWPVYLNIKEKSVFAN
jgi:hypothetical protein